MASLNFECSGTLQVMQCKLEDKMKDIFDKYCFKTQRDRNSIYFLYSGERIEEEKLLSEVIGNNIENAQDIKILVCSTNAPTIEHKIEQSRFIRCPECGEGILLGFEDYKINLSHCKNDHSKNGIFINQFQLTQMIDITEIKCQICNDEQKNKGETHNNEFYICFNCNKNICPLCKLSHDKSHNVVKYDEKNYFCNKHQNEKYVKFCNNCKLNVCILCESEHENHSSKSFGSMMPKEEIIKEKMKEFKKEIDLFKIKVDNIISNLEFVKKNLDKYYEINETMLKNYKPSFKNYETLTNINQINNNIHNILSEIKLINSENSDQTLNILNIYQKMVNKETSEVNLTYNINREENTINIFGTDFVKNNKDKCKMFIDGKEYEISKKFDITNYDKEKLEIKLKGINKVTDMSCMFSGCSTLISIENFTNLNTSKVTNMNSMFSGCSSLLTIPDISNWDVSNVEDLSCLFHECSSLKSIPDISKWNIKNVKDLSCMFFQCSSLETLPDISNWDTSKVTRFFFMFRDCTSLISLPDISKWNITNATDLSGIFYGCESLKTIPDISGWTTNNVTDMSWMFKECRSLSALSDISKWNINNVTDFSLMFEGINTKIKISSEIKTKFKY